METAQCSFPRRYRLVVLNKSHIGNLFAKRMVAPDFREIPSRVAKSFWRNQLYTQDVELTNIHPLSLYGAAPFEFKGECSEKSADTPALGELEARLEFNKASYK